jgi:translation initiation factor 3 subunit A
VAKKALEFYSKHQRKTEFRRLCEILRNHFTQILKEQQNKVSNSRDRQDLATPDTLYTHLEIRFDQLLIACDLDTWQGGFTLAEEIHYIMTILKDTIHVKFLSEYHSKLADIFHSSKNRLFHAYALILLYQNVREMSPSPHIKERSLLASAAILATLAILPLDGNSRGLFRGSDKENDRNRHMSDLFFEDHITSNHRRCRGDCLTRDILLDELRKENFLSWASDDVRRIYFLFEKSSHLPSFDLCFKLKPYLDNLRTSFTDLKMSTVPIKIELSNYVAGLKERAVLQIFHQLQDVYSNIRYDHLFSLIPFMSANLVERMLVNATKCGYLLAQVDHRTATVSFIPETLKIAKFKRILLSSANELTLALGILSPAVSREMATICNVAIQTCRLYIWDEHVTTIARKHIIEKQKEELENKLAQEGKKESIKAEREIEQKQFREGLANYTDCEDVRRETHSTIKNTAKCPSETIKHRGIIREHETHRKEELQSTALHDHQEMMRKLQKMAKTMDHFERARRVLEDPLWSRLYCSKFNEERKKYEEEQSTLHQSYLRTWEFNIHEKHRFQKMREDAEIFAKKGIKFDEREESEGKNSDTDESNVDNTDKTMLVARRKEFSAKVAAHQTADRQDVSLSLTDSRVAMRNNLLDQAKYRPPNRR